ncbi:MAG: heme-binding protein [Gammaproteobacteria bacterium]|nr:heme-binding protein [Gammaproteobacteria bacterium]MDH5799686.1 heme-binding protein [Gammaproteobacteria bacterium]
MRAIVLIFFSVFCSSLWASDDPLVISTKRLTMESSLKMARAAIQSCRKKGIQVGVTVVDRNGQSQVMLRDVLAPFLTVEVSMKKANTSAMFMAATSAMERQGSSSLAHMDNLMFGAGGLPIQAGGEMYGAIGVSGAPDGKLDEECAQAGIDAIKEDLEMM